MPSGGQISWVENEMPRERLRDLDFFSLKRRKVGRYLRAVFNDLVEELQDRQSLFQETANEKKKKQESKASARDISARNKDNTRHNEICQILEQVVQRSSFGDFRS